MRLECRLHPSHSMGRPLKNLLLKNTENLYMEFSIFPKIGGSGFLTFENDFFINKYLVLTAGEPF